MPEGHVLEFTRVTKRFNDVTAVSDFSARVEPGVVTAFLGPNGAGKTTSLRILLGQVRPTSGTATIGGVAYADLRTPLKTIGAVLEETVYRPRRTATRQLTIAAKANGIPLSRVDEVLALVGLHNEGEGRIGSFSLGMRQRLSVAHALLGDAPTLVFDEPANGLDPEGIRWMRLLMRRLADEGRTVLVSSHVLSEVEQIADHVLVLSKGQLVLSSGIESLADPASGSVVVDAIDRAALTAALAAAGFEVEVLRSGLTVRGGDAKTVGAVAASAGIALNTLLQRGPTLEDVFIDLVRGGKLEPRAAIAAAPVEDAGVEGAEVEGAGGEEPVVEEQADDGVEEQADAGDVADAEESTDAAGGDDVDAGETVTADAAESESEGSDDAAASDDVASGPSFDDVLFGSGEAVPAETSVFDAVPDAGESSDGADIFARLSAAAHGDDAEESADSAYSADDEDAEGSDAAEESASDEEPQNESSEDDGAADTEDDPRSAAVSSLLAAAARAYYDDEPQPYPFGEAAASDSDSDDAESGDADSGEAESGDADSDDADSSDAESSEHDGSEHADVSESEDRP